MSATASVAIAIVRFADDAFPGWVECRLVDAHGVAHAFVEKVPIMTTAPLDATSAYPQPGAIACTLLARRRDDAGRDLVTIDTAQPWGIASVTGETRFEVAAAQLATD